MVLPDKPVILLTGVLIDPTVVSAVLKTKVACCLEKTSSLAQILDAVRRLVPRCGPLAAGGRSAPDNGRSPAPMRRAESCSDNLGNRNGRNFPSARPRNPDGFRECLYRLGLTHWPATIMVLASGGTPFSPRVIMAASISIATVPIRSAYWSTP